MLRTLLIPRRPGQQVNNPLPMVESQLDWLKQYRPSSSNPSAGQPEGQTDKRSQTQAKTDVGATQA